MWVFFAVGFLRWVYPRKTHLVFLGTYPGVWTLDNGEPIAVCQHVSTPVITIWQRLTTPVSCGQRQPLSSGASDSTKWLSTITTERWRPWTHLLWQPLGILHLFVACALAYWHGQMGSSTATICHRQYRHCSVLFVCVVAGSAGGIGQPEWVSAASGWFLSARSSYKWHYVGRRR